jgi:hypothetical protein
MSLPSRQQRLLRGIDDAVCRSDPRLASMLAIFGRLTAGEEMPGREELRTPPLSRVRAVLLAAATAAAALITRAAGACARGLRSAATACAAAAGLAGHNPLARRAASSRSPAAGTRASARPGQPRP